MQHDVLIQPYEHSLDDYEHDEQTTTEEASSNDGEAAEEPQVSNCFLMFGLKKCCEFIILTQYKLTVFDLFLLVDI